MGDPLTLIVTALAAGALAGVQPTAEQIIKDAYAGIKELIKRRYERVSVEVIENDPADERRRAIVQADLQRAGAGDDAELLEQARALLHLIETHAPAAAEAIGVDLKAISGRNLTIDDVRATGTGVRVEDAELSEDITIKRVRAGAQGQQDPNA